MSFSKVSLGGGSCEGRGGHCWPQAGGGGGGPQGAQGGGHHWSRAGWEEWPFCCLVNVLTKCLVSYFNGDFFMIS